jgi:hypothetical protein
VNRNKLLIYFGVLLAGLSLSFFITRQQFNPQSTAILVFFLVFVPTLIKPDIGLAIIIVSALLSPDLILGMTSQREITVRIEDVFLLVVILAWLIRAAFTKDIAKVFKTRLTPPYFLYIIVCILSTVLASLFARIDAAYSFFSILKYLQYFILFLMVKDHIHSLKQVKVFTAIFLLVALIVAIHANVFIQEKLASGATFFRASPPVETRGTGQAGTMGGYLLFMIAIAAGLLLYLRPVAVRVFLICLILLMFRAFLYTLSRGSYLAFLPVWFTLVLFSKKFNFAYLSAAILIIITILMPSMIKNRIAETVVFKEGMEGTYLEFEESPRARLDTWKWALLKEFPSSPIFGHGVGTKFIDGQFFLTLYETGLAGLILFIVVLMRLFKIARGIFDRDLFKDDEFSSGLSLGFLAGFIGLIFHAISTNTFIIIRIMEPFWFMTAMVLTLPQLLLRQQEKAQEQVI